MKPLQPAYIPKSEITSMMQSLEDAWTKDKGASINNGVPMTRQELEAKIVGITAGTLEAKIWRNDVYQVAVYENPEASPLVHLSIKRTDRKPIHDWRDLQAIKNQLVGPECEGVELYPAESRRVDTANQFHIWCIRDANYRFPFGFAEGRHVTDTPIGKSENRPVTH